MPKAGITNFAMKLMTRRRLLKTAPLGLTAASIGSGHAETAAVFAAIEARAGGRLGVYVRDLGSGRSLAHRAGERFMLCSTFKGVLAGLVLSDADAGRISLAELIPYHVRDLLPASPVTSLHVQEGALSVGKLCQAILHVSDNTAANLLLARCGGPARLTHFVRGLGDQVTRFDRYEPAAGHRNGDMDTTTPRNIANTAATLLTGTVLSEKSRAMLRQWMVENDVGSARLRATLPLSWVVADRTGTGDGFCNDYALAVPPGHSPLIMSAYYEAAGMLTARQEVVIRAVGAAIAQWHADTRAR